MNFRVRYAAFASALALAGCGSGSHCACIPYTPVANASLATYYTGTESVGAASVPVAFYVVQSGSQLSGTWGDASSAQGAEIGTFTGTVSGTNVNANLVPTTVYRGATIGCATNVNGTAGGSTIAGTFSTTGSCSTSQTGTFSVTQSTAPGAVSASASGTLSDSVGGSGAINVSSVALNGVTVSGNYTTTFTGAQAGTSGPLDGVFIGNTLYVDLLASQSSACPYIATGTVSGTTLSGKYAAADCSTTETGTFDFSNF